jgi:CubicO group peptidase (beta-lactamase class C family)
MKQLGILFLLLLLFHSPVFAQPEIEGIENYIENARKDWGVLGMSVAIVKDGKVISNRGYGVLEQGRDKKIDEHTLFAIASNTKAFISSSIGILHEEGKLDLQDKVQQYLPDFQLYDSYVSNETTVADLLCHRIGLGTYSGDIIWYKSNFSGSG